MNINFKIKKKDLWLLSAIVVFMVGVGYVIAIGSGDYQIQGHDLGEIGLPNCAVGNALVKTATGWDCGTGGGSSSAPYYRVKYLSATDKYTLADFVSALYQTKLVSYGEISGDDHEFVDGSYLLEMKVNAVNSVTKTLKVMAVDNRVDFFMDGNHVAGPWDSPGFYASDPNIKADFTMNPGEHTIQIIFNAQGSYDYLTLWGDIVDNTNVQFVAF